MLLQNRCHSHDQSWWNGVRSARLERELGGELSEICTRQLQDHCGSRLQSAENPDISEQWSASSQSTWEPSQHRAQRCQFRLEPEHRHHQKGHHEVHGGKSVPAMLGGVGLLGWWGECKLLMTTDSPRRSNPLLLSENVKVYAIYLKCILLLNTEKIILQDLICSCLF